MSWKEKKIGKLSNKKFNNINKLKQIKMIAFTYSKFKEEYIVAIVIVNLLV